MYNLSFWHKIFFVFQRSDIIFPCVSAIWYNPVLAMHLLDKYKLPNSNESVVEQFFNQLFSDAEVFIGIHDKKGFNKTLEYCF